MKYIVSNEDKGKRLDIYLSDMQEDITQKKMPIKFLII